MNTPNEERLERRVTDLLHFVRDVRDTAGRLHGTVAGMDDPRNKVEYLIEGLANLHDNAVAELAACGEQSVPLGGRGGA